MKPASAKAKGRRAAKEIAAALCARLGLDSEDVRVTPSGVSGPDLMLSSAAYEKFPYEIEIKNVEKLNFWKAIEQAESHSKESGRTPLLAFRRNNEPMRVVIDFDHFIKLLQRGMK